MNKIIKKSSLLVALSISLNLASCGGAGGGTGSSATAADNVSVNGTTYTENGTTLKIDGYLIQTSPYAYKYGGPMAIFTMNDSSSKNSLFFQVLSTIDRWPGVYSLQSNGTETIATITDKSVTTGGLMKDLANGSGTGGSIAISSFGDVGQTITGSYNVDLCDQNTVCTASIRNYTGTFSINRSPNYGSLAKPSPVLIPVPAGTSYTNGIHPTTGKNYYAIPSNTTGGTLTLTLTPTVDVNMAVFTDAGFTTVASCNVTSTLNVVGSGVETCAITVTANQKVYVTVSQTTAATAFETYTLKVAE